MKRSTACLLIVCLGTLTVKATFGQDSLKKAACYIAKYKGDRDAAVCYSFDDGIRDQYTITYPMLKKYDFVATFFVIPAQIPKNDQVQASSAVFKNRITWEQLQLMAKDGMEIANHSWTHSKNLTTLNDQQLTEEIDKADSAISKIIGKKPLTFAYPWNAFSPHTQAAVLKDHIAAREFQYGIGSRFTTEDGNRWIDGLIRKKAWGISMAHAMSNGFDTLKSPDVLDQHFKYVKAHTAQIWVTTFESLSKYVKERDNSSLTVDFEKNKTMIHLNITLPKNIYNEPLTVVLPLPAQKNNVRAKQGNKKLTIFTVGDEIMFDVLPTGQDVEVSW